MKWNNAFNVKQIKSANHKTEFTKLYKKYVMQFNKINIFTNQRTRLCNCNFVRELVFCAVNEVGNAFIDISKLLKLLKMRRNCLVRKVFKRRFVK